MGHANDIASLADDAIAQLSADVEDVVLRLRAYLEKLLDQADVDEEGRLTNAGVNAELAAKLEASFSDVLRELGYDGALERLMTSFDEVLAANGAHLEDTLGTSFSSANREQLGAFVNGVADELVHLEGEAGAKLRTLMLLGASTHVPRGDLVAELADAAGITLRQAVNEADTSIMAFHRESLTSEAEAAGFDLFLYDGPDDGLTRPFCAEHVGRIYTTDDIDAEDNGQGLQPTSRYCGGYRCRHSMQPLTLDEAKRMVERSGERVIGGPEARRIILGDEVGSREAAFVAEHTGAVVTRAGKQQVVRRRRA